MANLQETAQWETGIYQLETSDPVMGGADGIDNRQAKQLGNRTLWLKNELEQMAREIPAAVTKSDAVNSDSSATVATSKAVKTAYDKALEAAKLGVPVGAVVGFPRAVTSPEGYLKADGSTFNQSTYPDLYRVLGGNKLPKLTRSDVGMTAYFPVSDTPDGWIKYDEIATRVTQSAYPELYRKLVAQYGSIAAVPKAEDRFIRNTAGGLTVGQIQADEIKKHVHKHISYSNVGSGRVGLRSKYFEDSTDIDPVSSVTVTSDNGGEVDNGWITPKDDSPFATGGAETRPKAIAMVLCIKAQNSLDDVVMWIKAFGAVANAGLLDASRLAQGLQEKEDKGHTHRMSDIGGLSDALDELQGKAQKTANGWCRLPNGLILQWGFKPAPTGRYDVNQSVVFPVTFPTACLNVSLTPSMNTFDTDHNTEFGVHSLSQSGFKFWTWLNPYLGHYWMAIGY